MSNYKELATALNEALSPALPPIAFAMLDAAPQNAGHSEGAVAAGCAFWEKAANQVFTTVTADHELCAIGIHTHNMSDRSESQMGELQTAPGVMMGLDYVREEEVAGIPVMKKSVRYATYGPLAGFPTRPDAVILFADAVTSLTLAEATAPLTPACRQPWAVRRARSYRRWSTAGERQ